jgi:hypothetical protein
MLRQPMIARGGANILWAEPETGWEAYISGKPGMRDRNIGILREAARRLQVDAADLLDGTTHAAAGAVAAAPPAGGGVSAAVPGVVELGPATIMAIGREVARLSIELDGQTVTSHAAQGAWNATKARG